jgi:hypothetical protein
MFFAEAQYKMQKRYKIITGALWTEFYSRLFQAMKHILGSNLV